MGQYRICSFCGKKNSSDIELCSCNNLLIYSLIIEEIDNSALIDNKQDANLDVPNTTNKFKICPVCGNYNDFRLQMCAKCNETLEDVFDLVDLTDTKEELNGIKKTYSPYCLVSTGGYVMNLPLGECIIGRDECMGADITALGRMYVSSKHLIVHTEANGVKIKDISRNGTFLNMKKLPDGCFHPYKVGDTLGLGGMSEELDRYGYFLTLVRN